MPRIHRHAAICLAAACLLLSAASAVHGDSIHYKFTDGASGVRLISDSGIMPRAKGFIHTDLMLSAPPPHKYSVPVDITLRDGNVKSGPIQLGTLSEQLGKNSFSFSYTPKITSLTFDGRTYHFSYPSIRLSGNYGKMVERLTFRVTDPNGSSTTPEPSSLVLAVLGIPLLGLFCCRSARRSAIYRFAKR